MLPRLSATQARALVALVAASVYANSLHNDFVFDDVAAIETNLDLTDETTFAELFRHDFWGKDMSDVASHKSWRPLTVLSFRATFQLVGLKPFWFRVTNVCLHALASALAFDVGRCWLEEGSTSSTLDGGQCVTMWSSIVAGLLFAVHPIHTEAVGGAVVGRADLLAAVFYFSAYLLYVRFPLRTNATGGLSWHFPLCCSLLLASIFSKEIGLTLPGVLALDDLVRVGRSLPRRRSLGDVAGNTAAFAIILSACMGARFALSGDFPLPQINKLDNHIHHEESFVTRSLSYQYLDARYFWLLLFPMNLCADYSPGCIPCVRDILDPRNALVLFMYSSLTAVALR